MIGGQAGLTGHLHIGRGARLGAQAGVMADVQAGAELVGSPATPVRVFFRQVAALRRLAERARSSRSASVGHDAAATDSGREGGGEVGSG
jgi:UDP-3-O-[3-hydroxymyristoyl] glucosamine N-acyltransferase